MSKHHSDAGKLGAYAKWANTPDRKAATAKAREAYNNRFHREVREKFPNEPDHVIDQMAAAARKLHYQRLSMLASAARKRYARERRSKAA